MMELIIGRKTQNPTMKMANIMKLTSAQRMKPFPNIL